MFDFSNCAWQGTQCYGSDYAALISEINVVIRASLLLTQAGLQQWAVIVKCSLDSISVTMHEQWSIFSVLCQNESQASVIIEILKLQ